MEKEAPYDNGKLTKTYEMITKDKEGEAHRHTMHVFDYNTPGGYDRSFLSQAAPTIINSAEVSPRRSKTLLTADIPDIHYGFRKIDGVLVPTHNPEVMDVALQMIKKEQPNLIIIGGDAIDAPNVGKYEMDSLHFVDTMQLCIDGLYRYFSRLRADNPNARIVHLVGNHESRFNKYLLRNAQPLFGLKRADMPEDYAAISYPSLLRLNDLEIEYTDRFRINDELITEHGDLAGSSTAAKYLGRYATSLLFHHDHRRGYERRVFPDGKAIEAFGFGCQADIAGSVPSYHSKVSEFGKVVERYENWHNGMGFIESTKTMYKPTAIPIERQDDYLAIHDHKTYKPRPEVVEALRSGK